MQEPSFCANEKPGADGALVILVIVGAHAGGCRPAAVQRVHFPAAVDPEPLGGIPGGTSAGTAIWCPGACPPVQSPKPVLAPAGRGGGGGGRGCVPELSPSTCPRPPVPKQRRGGPGGGCSLQVGYMPRCVTQGHIQTFECNIRTDGPSGDRSPKNFSVQVTRVV